MNPELTQFDECHYCGTSASCSILLDIRSTLIDNMQKHPGLILNVIVTGCGQLAMRKEDKA